MVDPQKFNLRLVSCDKCLRASPREIAPSSVTLFLPQQTFMNNMSNLGNPIKISDSKWIASFETELFPLNISFQLQRYPYSEKSIKRLFIPLCSLMDLIRY